MSHSEKCFDKFWAGFFFLTAQWSMSKKKVASFRPEV